MAAMSYRNFYDKRILDKALFIEMNEAALDTKTDSTLRTEVTQPLGVPRIQIQGPESNQGSILSLATRSIADQSDLQPLTEIHACRYDECTKFHNKPAEETSKSPASPLKNFFLFLLIGLLILWILIYTTLVQFKIL